MYLAGAATIGATNLAGAGAATTGVATNLAGAAAMSFVGAAA